MITNILGNFLTVFRVKYSIGATICRIVMWKTMW